MGVNAGIVRHLEWSRIDKADPTHFATATSQVVNQRPKHPRKKLDHTRVARGIGKLATPAPQDLLRIVALEVAVALRLMKHFLDKYRFLSKIFNLEFYASSL